MKQDLRPRLRFPSGQTGKHLRPRRCFRSKVSWFSQALKLSMNLRGTQTPFQVHHAKIHRSKHIKPHSGVAMSDLNTTALKDIETNTWCISTLSSSMNRKL